MVIRGILVGTCIINDLRDLRIAGGQFLDLDGLYPPDEISRSLKPPKGSLHVAISSKLVEIVDEDGFEYRKWRETLANVEREAIRRRNRRDIRYEMTEYWEMGRGHRRAYIQGLTSADVAVLERIRGKEDDRELLDMINDKLGIFADVQFPAGFVLL